MVVSREVKPRKLREKQPSTFIQTLSGSSSRRITLQIFEYWDNAVCIVLTLNKSQQIIATCHSRWWQSFDINTNVKIFFFDKMMMKRIQINLILFHNNTMKATRLSSTNRNVIFGPMLNSPVCVDRQVEKILRALLFFICCSLVTYGFIRLQDCNKAQ